MAYRFLLNQIVTNSESNRYRITHTLYGANESNRDLTLPNSSHVDGKRTAALAAGAKFVASSFMMFFAVCGIGLTGRLMDVF